jgi:HSP20 family protein
MVSHSGAVRDPERLTARVLETATRRSGCRLDTYREGDTYYIDVELPGVDPADIDVTVDGAVLTLRASRPRAQGGDRRPPLGLSSRQIPLSSALDTDRLEAGYSDGVLTLRIPIVTAEPAADAARALAA